MIPFNKTFFTGKEVQYISNSIENGKIAGDGFYTKKCQEFFETKYGFKKTLLTTSCTDALEMAAILLDIQPGDEVIAPSYTFVSTVNAFVLRGAKIIFADSSDEHPNIDVQNIARLITAKTRAIVVVHYAGVACDMDAIMELASGHNIPVVEDAAQAIDSYYKGKPLGSIGTFGTFSFHETKNIVSGEGGMLAINDESYIERAEIIREKGTNRASFFRGEVAKYGWVDIGSSFLPSDMLAAFLYAQLEEMDNIQQRRKAVWARYHSKLSSKLETFNIELPFIDNDRTNNAHMFYLVCSNLAQRTKILAHLKEKGVNATFHYVSLHSSDYFRKYSSDFDLPNTDKYSDCLLRLPLYCDLTEDDVDYICDAILVSVC